MAARSTVKANIAAARGSMLQAARERCTTRDAAKALHTCGAKMAYTHGQLAAGPRGGVMPAETLVLHSTAGDNVCVCVCVCMMCVCIYSKKERQKEGCIVS